MKAVHFGAGNIGRGFIGHMLSASDYEVCFVARNQKQIALLQKRQEYPITLANDEQDTTLVSNVTAISIHEEEQVAAEIASAAIITTAVGVNALKDIARSIAQGISLRLQQKVSQPLHIVACENAIAGSTRLKKHVYPLLSEAERQQADTCISFPNAAVDRIVPLQKHQDPLQVTVEPFFEWVIHRPALLEGFQEIKGVHYVDSLEPYIERKMFTVNTGHCCAAYLGSLQGFTTIRQAMKDPHLVSQVRQVMNETGQLITTKHGFNAKQHQQYIDAILARFANPHLSDKVTRVGRSPLRKLSPNDRLVRPLLQAYDAGIETPGLQAAIAAALMFHDPADKEAVALQQRIAEHGVSKVIHEHMGIHPDHPVHKQLLAAYEELKSHTADEIIAT
ncbi:mannitol-1-phosphate 5-dehydrogenase [Paenibacillus sp. JSM ZJ436]|uniref:mannitol-1-phosphate 5-dehydrogenase n=1 Tax=Paenibacillus sp. JSM ZJ436 TaxID=3376190 RepID=UPI00378B495B